MRDRFFFLFILFGILFTSQAFAITDTNLRSYYNFDETSGTTLIDLKNDNNGTNSNATVNQAGLIGKSYSFTNASESKITVATEADYDFINNASNNSTVCVWAKYNASPNFGSLWSKGTYPTGSWVNTYTTGGERLQNNFFKDGSNAVYKEKYGAFQDGAWHLICSVRTGTTLTFYRDTNAISSNTVVGTPGTVDVSQALTFGWDNQAGHYYTGYLDEASIWERALSATDINDLYNAGTGTTYCPLTNSFNSICPTDSINVDFNYVVRKDLNKILLTDTSTVSRVTKTAWSWTNNGVEFSTAQDYNLTALELTDYNICLHVDTNVSDVTGDKCYQFNTGDWTPPVTTFSSFQVPNSTDQNITLTCTDTGAGCKAINYNINNTGWLRGVESFSDTNNINDSTQYSHSTITWTTKKTYSLETDKNAQKMIFGEIDVWSSNGVHSGYSRLKYNYSDETFDYSNTVSNTSDPSNPKEFTTLSDDNKKLISIELQLYVAATPLTAYVKDFNFILEYIDYSTTTYSFLYSGAGLDHNIQFFSTDNSDNTETTKTSNFTTYGNARFYFKDENSGSDLTGVQVNFNGVDYNSGANNYLDFNFQTLGSTNTTYLFTITKTGYSTRYYQADLNYFGDFNNTFALIQETLATNIQFKMFPPTGTTTLANTYIEFKDKDTNYTITRLKSNENGELTANLRSDDQNYLVWISEGTYIYQAVQLTILYPKDEQTLSDITGNWRIEITDNISYQDLNIPQGTNKIIYLLPNTKYPFTIAVQDVAGTYFKRKWSKIYQGNPLTDTLQPYLVNADDGIAVKFVFQDPKRDSIENIIINIYKNVGGIKTLISSGASDVTGNALFFLIAGDKYTLDFSYDGTIIFETQNYTVTSSTVYWTINLATREIKTVDGTFITIGFNPIQDYILKNATNISYKVTASGLNRTRAEFYIIQDGNKIITYTRDAPCTTPCTVTIPIEDLNITLGNKVYLDLNVYIDSNNYIFNYKKTWSYGTTSNIDTHDLFVKARIDFGCTTDTMWPCPLTSIVSIIIMILLIGSMVFTFNFVNPKGLLVAGLGILAVFTYLGWFWWVALVLIIIASIFYLRGD